jgi:hypothetical protein
MRAAFYTLFSCVPTGWKAGMVEFVEDAKTFREIQVSYQMIQEMALDQ